MKSGIGSIGNRELKSLQQTNQPTMAHSSMVIGRALLRNERPSPIDTQTHSDAASPKARQIRSSIQSTKNSEILKKLGQESLWGIELI